jgi:putative transposase
MNGVEDHVHVLCYLPKSMSVVDFIRSLKAYSSRWMHEHDTPMFEWQSGYAILGVSKTSISRVSAYIKNQEQHHAEVPFSAEWEKIAGQKEHGTD